MNAFREEMIMEDKIEQIGKGSIIQHGKFNNRIYLIKLKDEDCPEILHRLRDLARENRYSKIFCKVPGWAAPYFFADGYITEAYIPGFYRLREPAFFLAKYTDSDRLMQVEQEQLGKFGHLLHSGIPPKKTMKKSGFKAKLLHSSDVEQITEIYRAVFQSYPFPIHNPGYILKTMKEDVRYYGIFHKKQLMAVSSAEMDLKGKNAEMTDFATLPDFRGKRLGQRLLAKMEKEMKGLDIKTLYTIARLNSIPMNKVFLHFSYRFAGTLVKNTNISGRIESMNVYYKHI